MLIQELNQLYGRQMPESDLPESLAQLPTLERRPAILLTDKHAQCQRCGQPIDRRETQLPDGSCYCGNCIQLGRMRSTDNLCSLPEPNRFPEMTAPLTWTGQLTPLQAGCSSQIRQYFKSREDHLMWSVTGAGKTEMLFEGIAWAIANGLRVAIASPRVDVCLELAPRLKQAFSTTDQVVLYGDMPDDYRYCQLTICTTHQLLRFYHAFDVLVIDEVDAFPYAADPGLHFAVQQAKKTAGAALYLTATPSRQLLRQVKRHELQVSYLPVGQWRKKLAQHQLPTVVVRQLKAAFVAHRRFLFFVPHIADLAPIAAAIEAQFANEKAVTVYSADPERHVKVQQMRDGQIDFLLTTTILERGVTFPDIDVFVLGADDRVFSTAALVQIAGRVGRSAQAPEGLVQFFVTAKTGTIRRAQQQIEFVNRKAKRLTTQEGT
ncbi:DEAD/DEAH box helicase [Secundilactobacillus paracollinoides]|uniref:DEAD/DEAH box helicase n=1 Tax=Secundilactobacillus paracollinoides TaxID=240427 RepID=UPI0006EF3B9D|nr:helicase-related protein [Secundilactobacillus paracollinoides]KRL80046.1 helicase domain-containing protein [Secundilactobacillus paracollinoides DSM 15502 = JCM 11969]